MTIIEQIKAELERRKKLSGEKYNESVYSMGRCDAFCEMLNFINELEESESGPND